MKLYRYLLLDILIICIFASAVYAGSSLILLDFSGSMSKQFGGGKSKITESFKVLREVVTPSFISGNQAAGLWAFANCNELRYCGKITSDPALFQKDLNLVENMGVPDGNTPLAWAIRNAIEELRKYPEPRNLIIISDGAESCGGDPCAEVMNGRAQEMQISIHTIGLDISEDSSDFQTLQCISNESYGGIATALKPDNNTTPQEIHELLNQSVKGIVQNIVQKEAALPVQVVDSGVQSRLEKTDMPESRSVNVEADNQVQTSTIQGQIYQSDITLSNVKSIEK